MGFKKAERKQSKIKMALLGPSGSGKTMSALLIAGGLSGGKYDTVGLIDTESSSAALYANVTVGTQKIGEFQTLVLDPPFEVPRYVNAIKLAEECGITTLVIDSLSHAWVGASGLLEKHNALAEKTGNSFNAWGRITPELNKLIDAILQSNMHVICTMRSKTEYAVDGNKVRKLGLAPMMKDGTEYEFGIVFDIGANHQATVSKDRTGLFDGKVFIPSVDTGREILTWLNAKS